MLLVEEALAVKVTRECSNVYLYHNKWIHRHQKREIENDRSNIKKAAKTEMKT